MIRAVRYLPLLLSAFLVLAWGTCPCLYAEILVGSGDDTAAPCCCQVENDGQPPRNGTDECPCCSSVGCMHEFPPVSNRLELDDVEACVAFAVNDDEAQIDVRVWTEVRTVDTTAPPDPFIRSVILLL